jgi:hypothetical protein
MRNTQYNDLAERHGRGTAGEQQGNGMGTAWERHGMYESALKVISISVSDYKQQVRKAHKIILWIFVATLSLLQMKDQNLYYF